jgi:hypothetical protein
LLLNNLLFSSDGLRDVIAVRTQNDLLNLCIAQSQRANWFCERSPRTIAKRSGSFFFIFVTVAFAMRIFSFFLLQSRAIIAQVSRSFA